MIYKIIPRKSPLAFSQLFRYICGEDKRIAGHQLFFTHNLRGRNEQEWTDEFLKNEAYRPLRKNRTFAYHSILSFGKEPVSDQILESVIRAYFKKRGHVLAFAGVHRDRDHTHYHIIESATLYRQGRSARMSFAELKDLKLHVEDFVRSQHPELTKSFCEHGTGKYAGRDSYRSKESVKDRVVSVVRSALESSTTRDEFIRALQANDLHIYERRAWELTGIQADDRRFRFFTLGLESEVASLSHENEREQENELLLQIQTLRAQMGLDDHLKER